MNSNFLPKIGQFFPQCFGSKSRILAGKLNYLILFRKKYLSVFSDFGTIIQISCVFWRKNSKGCRKFFKSFLKRVLFRHPFNFYAKIHIVLILNFLRQIFQFFSNFFTSKVFKKSHTIPNLHFLSQKSTTLGIKLHNGEFDFFKYNLTEDFESKTAKK